MRHISVTVRPVHVKVRWTRTRGRRGRRRANSRRQRCSSIPARLPVRKLKTANRRASSRSDWALFLRCFSTRPFDCLLFCLLKRMLVYLIGSYGLLTTNRSVFTWISCYVIFNVANKIATSSLIHSSAIPAEREVLLITVLWR